MQPTMSETPWKPTRQQLLDAVHKTVPDLIAPNLKVLFAGINPGLYTAAIGHHFGRPGNRFWPTLHAALLDVSSGSYIGPSRMFGTRGVPAVMKSHPLSYDEAAAARLFAISEARTAVRFPYTV